MRLDLIGTLKPFAEVGYGEFFLHHSGGVGARFALKACNKSGDEDTVLSFDKIHPGISGPHLVPTTQFVNRDVLALSGAALRPSYADLYEFRDGSPPRTDAYGTAIFINSTVLLRAYGISGAVDVDLKSGVWMRSIAHPGSMWTDGWKIVVATASGEIDIVTPQQMAKVAAA